jgi:hypothetical protein
MDNQINQSKPKRTQTRYPRPRRKEVRAAWGSSRPAVSADALDLSDDILRLEQIKKLLWQINPLHITTADTKAHRRSGEVQLRTTTAVIMQWERYAKQRLRKDYLAPHRDDGR